MDKPLSNIDLNDLIKEIDKKGVNIEQCNDITQKTNIEDIFKNRGHVVLFKDWEQGDDVGHWIVMLRNPKKEVLLFDSLNTPLNTLNKNIGGFLKNNKIKKLYINDKKYQNDESSVCGRYSVIIVALHKLGLSYPYIIKFMDDLKTNNQTFDEGVLNITGDI